MLHLSLSFYLLLSLRFIIHAIPVSVTSATMISSQIYYHFEENCLHQALNTVTAMIKKQSQYYPCYNRFQTSTTASESGRHGLYSSINVASFDSQRKPIGPPSPKTVAISTSPSSSSIQSNGKPLTSHIRREVCQWMYKVSWNLE